MRRESIAINFGTRVDSMMQFWDAGEDEIVRQNLSIRVSDTKDMRMDNFPYAWSKTLRTAAV